MFAVGQDWHPMHAAGARPVSLRPEEPGLQNHFLFRAALRGVKIRGRFGNAKNVGHAVIADVVAGTEIMVRVVVEGAPSRAARIAIVRRKLVMHARVPPHVLRYTLHVVGAFGGEHMPVELGIHVERVVRRPQRKTEVVHRHHVFQQLRLIQVTDAAGLPRVVERVRQRVGARVQFVVVLALVDAHAPQHDGRVIPVAPDHLADVAYRQVLPRLVADMLPARNLLEHQQP